MVYTAFENFALNTHKYERNRITSGQPTRASTANILHANLSNVMKLQFNNFAAWAPGLSNSDDWLLWAEGKLQFADSATPQVAEVPGLTRRRLTFWGRMALEVACQAGAGLDNTCPCVLSSRHGDTVRTFELLEAIAAGEPLSPTAFSLSVHNSALGIFSIVKNMLAGASAIAAGRDTLAQALLEAWCLLNSGAPRVLLIHVDSHLAEFYRPDADELEYPHAFASILSLSADPLSAISISSTALDSGFADSLPSAPPSGQVRQSASLGLQFLKFYYSDCASFYYDGLRLRWHFERLAKQMVARA